MAQNDILKFEIDSGGQFARVVGFAKPTEVEKLEIPSYYGRYPVKKIAFKAFENCNFSEVHIPEKVEYIGDSAFRDCKNLRKVTLPKGLREISIASFYGCKSLTDVKIPSSLEVLGACAFCSTALQSIVLPAGIRKVEASAFALCTNLKNITVEQRCNDVETTSGDESGTGYKSIDGVLYTSDGKTLVAYPCGRPDAIFDVPEGITIIADSAFFGCRWKKFHFPSHLCV